MALRTLPQNPAEWTLDDAKSIPARVYPEGVIDQKGAEATAAYIRGDHYQNGDAWIGAGYDANGQWVESSKARFKKTLTPVPEMFACLERRINGALGNEPDASIAPSEPAGEADAAGVRQPSEQQQTEIDEWRRDVVTGWWTAVGFAGGKDQRKPYGLRGLAALASASESGSACLRAFINPAARTVSVEVREGETVRTERRVPKQGTRAQALRHIKISTPPPDRCCIYVDPDTQEKTGVFLYKDFEDRDSAEVWFARDKGKGNTRETVLRTLTQGAEPQEAVYPWGGFFPIAEANVGCLLTDAVRRLQAALDLGGTSLSRLIQSHGYGQRTEIDAEEDGFWSSIAPALPNGEAPRTRKNETTEVLEYFWPLPAEMNPDVIRHLVGVPYLTNIGPDKSESWSITRPSVHEHEPSDPSAIVTGVDALLMWMRSACHQGHIRTGLSASSAEASGDAYEQARAAHWEDVRAVGEATDAPAAEILMCVTIMADYLCAVPDPASFAEQYGVFVQSHPSAGPPSTEFQRTTREMVDAELLSAQEGTARLGVQDVGGERDRIREENTVAAVEKRWTAFAAAVGNGADPLAFLTEELGYTEEKARKLLRSDGLPNVQQ